MQHQRTIEELINTRLQRMVDGLEAINQDAAVRDLFLEEKLSLSVDRQYSWRQNLALQQRLKRARLKGNTCVEDIDYSSQRGIDKAVCRRWRRNPPGLNGMRICSWSGRPPAESASWLQRWPTKRVAMALCCSTVGRLLCFAIWCYRTPSSARSFRPREHMPL